MTKTLYMLIGPKGSGKTYIRTVVATHIEPLSRVEITDAIRTLT